MESFILNQNKDTPDIALLNFCEFINSQKELLLKKNSEKLESNENVSSIAKKFPIILNKKELHHHIFPKFDNKDYVSYLQNINNSYKNLPVPNYIPASNNIISEFVKNNQNTFLFSVQEIEEFILQRSNNRSNDKYNISMNLLVSALETYGNNLLNFLSESFTRLINIPDDYTLHNDWCIANVYSRFKGGDEKNPARFRPLTCLPIIVRVFEGILSKKMHDMCLIFNIVDKNVQKAILKDSSGLWENRFEINLILNRAQKSNSNDIFVFIDYANAFGSVNYKNMSVILKKYNFPDNLIRYFTKYYSNIHGIYKDMKFKWTNGLIQGSSISNILFLIYIDFMTKNMVNDMKKMKFLPNDYESKGKIFSFVDDFVICLPNDSKNSERLRFIDLFSHINGLSINFDKSNFITFNSDLEKISFIGKELKRTSPNFKYLGMNLIVFEKDYFQDLSITLNNCLCQIDSMDIDSQSKLYICYQNILTRILPHLEIFFAINGFNDNIKNIFFLLNYFFIRWNVDNAINVERNISDHLFSSFISKLSKSISLTGYKNNFCMYSYNLPLEEQEKYNVGKNLMAKKGDTFYFLFDKCLPEKQKISSDLQKVKESKSFPKINFDKITPSFYGNNFIEFIT